MFMGNGISQREKTGEDLTFCELPDSCPFYCADILDEDLD